MEAITHTDDHDSFRDRLVLGKLLQAASLLYETFMRGRHGNFAAEEVLDHWNSVLRELKSLFFLRFGVDRRFYSDAQQMCVEMHQRLLLDSFRAVRPYSNRRQHRRSYIDAFAEEFDAEYYFHVGIIIRAYVAKLKRYLNSVHSWDQFNVRHCSCCTKPCSQQSQQSIIDRLSDIESVVISWQDVLA
jgi:hypothetical protein